MGIGSRIRESAEHYYDVADSQIRLYGDIMRDEHRDATHPDVIGAAVMILINTPLRTVAARIAVLATPEYELTEREYTDGDHHDYGN